MLALLMRLNPSNTWKHFPRSYSGEGMFSDELFQFWVMTPDRENARGSIYLGDSGWRLNIEVNDVRIVEHFGKRWGPYFERLQPYVLSIPGDPDEKRKAEEARKAYEIRIRPEQELKKTYGV